MNSKMRMKNALSHRQPDRIPIDFGGTVVTGMHVTCVAALRDYYKLEKKPVKVYEPFQMLGLIEDDLADVIGSDTAAVSTRDNLFGFSNTDWKKRILDNGLEVLVPGNFNTTVDEEGNNYIYPQGDLTSLPSGKMPKNGYYFDAIIRQGAIDDDNLNPEDNLEEFKPINAENLSYIKQMTQKAAATGKAVVGNFGGTALGDIALVPAPFLKNPKGIRDIEEWYISTVARQDYVHAVFEKQTQIAVENLKKLNDEVGGLIDVVFICGTDFGTQIGTFCSSDSYKEIYMPYYKRINNWIHSNTGWKTFKHSCGAVGSFIDLFIESGFDILNPVQCSAVGMEPQRLKEKYGKEIVFWGGGVDTQRILPFGRPEEVRDQVLQRCEIFARDGGFVFNAIHNVQANTPVENIAAMISAVKEFNGGR